MIEPDAPQARADLLLEWCSARGSGTRAQFNSASLALFGDTFPPAEVLRALEVVGHIEVDWERSGRWAVTPAVLNLAVGAGGNAGLIGARTPATWRLLHGLKDEGSLEDVTLVPQPEPWPSAWFVGCDSTSGFIAAAERIGAVVSTRAHRAYIDQMGSLDDVLRSARQEFAPSGFQAERLEVGSRLRFAACEVRYAQWPPGCFRQKSRGIDRYIYVDADRVVHLTDRWIATHCELRRLRELGATGYVPLSWNSETEQLFCDRQAQLPLAWVRAAVLCTGLAPTQERPTGGAWRDIYDGVDAVTYMKIADSLEVPHMRTRTN
jgi:hypothetical protein